MTAADVALLERLRAHEGQQVGAPLPGPDAVNEAMIRHWCEAVGDRLPVYTDPEAAAASVHGGIVAPPVMLQAWVMRGLRTRPAPGAGRNQQDELMAKLDEAGFTSVVATNCDQTYERYLRPGDRLHQTATIEEVSEEKSTALGRGHFITTRSDYHDQDGALVGSMRFRILKFRPKPKSDPKGREAARPPRPRPSLTQDNAFWFEGARQHRLLIQRCAVCGVLRHPPRPMCSACRSLEWDTVEASGRGHVHSFVVNHHPRAPAFDYPLVVVLVDLEEGTRLVSNLVDVEPSDVKVGMPVEASFVRFDDELTLPQFRPA